MPELFVEILSEEIPARMQAAAGAELRRITAALAAPLAPADMRVFWGPRRLALAATVAAESAAGSLEARGPRDTAPEAALAGFLGKHGATRDELVTQGGYYWLRRAAPPVPAAALLAGLGPAIAKFSWPKSMRWGQSGDFTWVRPLRGLVVLLDGVLVPTALGPVASGAVSQGHRVMGPGDFTVTGAAQWEAALKARFVIADPAERRRLVAAGLATAAAARQLSVVPDDALLDEVTGLVEWPVCLLGCIDEAFMDLPPEVRELSMKVNQKYFALRDAGGRPAPYFAFVANLEAPDGGAVIVAGNERVLRARLADARHFWDLDVKTPLDALLPKLEGIVFHAKIGTQRERADRIAALAGEIANALGGDEKQIAVAKIAGRLCKADLVTGMVGEFPQLQGVMGGYYSAYNIPGPVGKAVGEAITTHYLPKGQSDIVPTGLVPSSVALADKLDTLIQFFIADEAPTGSGDPYALRRAALGVIRIILENNLKELDLAAFVVGADQLSEFIFERLRVKLRAEGKRHDILAAVFEVSADTNFVRLMRRVHALSTMLVTDDGKNLLAAYKRASNILKIEDEKDELSHAEPNFNLMCEDAERALFTELEFRNNTFRSDLGAELYEGVMMGFSGLRKFVDAFFDKVTVNATEPALRRNRLALLASFRDTIHQIADFSKIEG